MIKTAIEYIVGLGKAEIHKENDQTFSDKHLYLVEEPTASPFKVHTLTGLVDYVSSDVDENEEVIIHVVGPDEVKVSSPLNTDMNRNHYVVAEALLPSFDFGRWYDTETFNIKLQSCFVKNDDRDVMLKVVGNIADENVTRYKDDGVSQKIVAHSGPGSVANVEVPNPVQLMPYRTFPEVVQPESDFIFRMTDGPKCGLFEADGGAWKNIAIENIQEYLVASLEKEIDSGRVTIIA